MKKIILVLSLLAISSCGSILTTSNSVILKGDPRINFKQDNKYWISIGKSHTPLQSYKVPDSLHKVRYIEVGRQKCWHISLSGPFIPIPIIPIFRVPHNYSIKIFPTNPFMDKKTENEFLSSLDVRIEVNGVSYKATLKDKTNEAFLVFEDKNFEFPIKCNAFDNAKIVVREPNLNDEIIVEIERDTNSYYQWVGIQ
jgi:hypothetical protein